MSSLEHRKISTLPIILASTQKRYVVSFTIFSGSWLKVALTKANRALKQEIIAHQFRDFSKDGERLFRRLKKESTCPIEYLQHRLER